MTLRTRADISITPNIPAVRSRLLFGFVHTDQSAGSDFPVTPSFTLNGSSLSVNDSGIAIRSGASDMKIICAYDSNGDGKIQSSEVIGWDQDPFKVVHLGTVQTSLTTLDTVRNGWANLGFSTAANFMWAFENDFGLTGATNVADTLAADTPGYTHNVGAIFNAQAVAPVNKAIFASTSSVAGEIATSLEVHNDVFAVLTAMRDNQTVRNAFASTGNPGTMTFTWSLNKNGINFAGSASDLHYAFGHVDVQNYSISLTVSRVFDQTQSYSQK